MPALPGALRSPKRRRELAAGTLVPAQLDLQLSAGGGALGLVLHLDLHLQLIRQGELYLVLALSQGDGVSFNPVGEGPQGLGNLATGPRLLASQSIC
jgi:hypothetical protein